MNEPGITRPEGAHRRQSRGFGRAAPRTGTMPPAETPAGGVAVSRPKKSGRRWPSLVFAGGIAVALVIGWSTRGEQYLTAESGLGYALGILGAGMMLLLLIYPLRKRVKFARRLGSMKFWFRFHMMLGILGPTLILFHANFGLGSLNSNVALWSMLIVAASGIVGRYFYSRIHMGLHGRQATIGELNRLAEASGSEVSALFAFAPDVRDRLLSFGTRMLDRRRGLFGSFFRYFATSVRAPLLSFVLRRQISTRIRVEASRAGWTRRDYRRRRRAARRLIRSYVRAVRRAAEFKLFERLFALWHVLHLPLFFMLIIAGIAHVVAVHMY